MCDKILRDGLSFVRSLGQSNEAIAKALDKLGKPDLVVTDYEPISAQVAYATQAPLVTITL
jgi:hypothetical protein